MRRGSSVGLGPYSLRYSTCCALVYLLLLCSMDEFYNVMVCPFFSSEWMGRIIIWKICKNFDNRVVFSHILP